MQREIETDHEEIVAYSGKPENGEKPFQKGFQGIKTSYCSLSFKGFL